MVLVVTGSLIGLVVLSVSGCERPGQFWSAGTLGLGFWYCFRGWKGAALLDFGIGVPTGFWTT